MSWEIFDNKTEPFEIIHTVNYNTSAATHAYFPDAGDQRVCFVDGVRVATLKAGSSQRIIIDGGVPAVGPNESVTGGQMYWESSTQTVYMDLDRAINSSNPPWKSVPRPPTIPSLWLGSIFRPDDSQSALYTFGGQRRASSVSNLDSVESKGQLYSFSVNSMEWKTVEVNGDSPLLVAGGMAADDTKRRFSYYLGGFYNYLRPGFQADPPDAPQYLISPSLLTFDHTTRRWTNQTVPDDVPTVGGFMQFIPAGVKGVLAVFGGLRYPRQKPVSIRDKLNTNEGELVHMTEIHLYDIDSGTWHTQEATGNQDPSASDQAKGEKIPPGRHSGCSVMMTAPDNSSWNVYMYAGGRVWGNSKIRRSDKIYVDDIWVLSLPSFEWVKHYGGTFEEHNIEALNMIRMGCTAWGSHLLMTPGVRDTGRCAENLFAWDLSINRLNTDSLEYRPYEVAEIVYNIIGGSSDGGASRKSPRDGKWNSSSVERIFKGGPVALASGNISVAEDIPMNADGGAKGPGMIAGASIGAILGITLIIGCVWFFYYRRRQPPQATVSYDPWQQGREEAGSNQIYEISGRGKVSELLGPCEMGG